MMVIFVLKQMKQLILRERSHDRASRSESTDILHSAANWRHEPGFQDACQGRHGPFVDTAKVETSLKHRKLELRDKNKKSTILRI